MGILVEDYFWLEAVVGIITIFVIFYHFWTQKYSYWKERNIPFIEPIFPLGNTHTFIFGLKFIGYAFGDFYEKFKGEKYGGIINVRTPWLILRDPEIIKQILTKDFHYFTDRGIPVDEENDPLSAHLFSLAGERWKLLRTKLTPTFTSGKMKMMFPLMQACGKQLEKCLLKHAEKEETIELKDLMTRFGTDVIGSCAFGLDINAINNPTEQFHTVAQSILQQSFAGTLANVLNSIIPGLNKLLKVRVIPKRIEDFFIGVVKDTVEYREKNKVERNDFLDLLIHLKNKGKLDDESDHKIELSNLKGNKVQKEADKTTANDLHLTIDVMTAQCFVFFLAGFETSSTTTSFCLYESTLNKSVQKKLQDEIDTVLAKHKGEISYEALKEMTYMDRVIQETLRKYPPAANILRECTADYKLEDKNVVLHKGIRILVPLYGLHYDPQYYPEPNRFDPDRFTEEAKEARHHYTWLPFGEGPRNCIGMRFGLLQVKIGLATILSQFNFDTTPETQIPIVIKKKSLTTAPEKGIKLKITKRIKQN